MAGLSYGSKLTVNTGFSFGSGLYGPSAPAYTPSLNFTLAANSGYVVILAF